jgi:hypothetical protein
MGMNFTKKVALYGVVIWQKVIETAQGGFALDVTGLTLGDTLKGGTLISFDESTRIAKVVKTATVQANAANNAVNIRVAKGHQFKIGDYVARSIGGAAYAITAISTTDPVYDQITIGTTLGVALTAGDALFISSATGASNAAVTLVHGQTGLSYEDYEITTSTDIAVVLRGRVYARRIPSITDDLKAKVNSIFFSQSY